MPLHDWTDRPGWEGLHIFWMTELARALRAALPPGYRAIIGSSPLVAIGAAAIKPGVAVIQPNGTAPSAPEAPAPEPDMEVAVATLEEDTSVQVEHDGRLVAVVELVSPRNKDRPGSRDQYAARYLSYLRAGVHTLLVDVHRRPLGFSFPQLIAAGLGSELPGPEAPSAVSYRVGGPAATGGRMLAVWHHALAIGAPLPPIPLALTTERAITLDLEGTYTRAAADSYVT
ncbi:hypothetical protein GobsT_09630 [Gemmata obscuriglobus]|uniref:DUF4058 domain-containing protein n=1 Tax=Gemmata obscuriglobus TaxID=114 RepID=A0A2Z3H429_9BACT|nr:DUF4058 family protein [Gemmata obscuriglobus]AWM40528.1 DUF4058 domain-containing protein [Gemmata obscuriglobus]QEG26224.1 hypothetical protein GobsT_09630 [Gemmata obscuriglobus]VTS00961.1 Uncharacterized protein OS=Candidatus Entotheonella sp. TSY1 GN=ETSY1_25480 PE=4 SV=1: DUF4058 [Gemmata obscuriglobus UQM 2246]